MNPFRRLLDCFTLRLTVHQRGKRIEELESQLEVSREAFADLMPIKFQKWPVAGSRVVEADDGTPFIAAPIRSAISPTAVKPTLMGGSTVTTDGRCRVMLPSPAVGGFASLSFLSSASSPDVRSMLAPENVTNLGLAIIAQNQVDRLDPEWDARFGQVKSRLSGK